jgi:hypothetical protein
MGYKGQMPPGDNTEASTYELLARQGDERYEPGKGPWAKDEELDQVDLVRLEELAARYGILSDERGLLSGCVERLVEEVRRARGWPTPPHGEENE